MKVEFFHHCSVLVKDTARSVKFYKEILALETDPSRPDLGYPGAWLKLGTSQIHLLELRPPNVNENQPAHVGRDQHMALGVTELAGFIKCLDAHQVGFTQSLSGRHAIFFRDPDGNGIELIEI